MLIASASSSSYLLLITFVLKVFIVSTATSISLEGAKLVVYSNGPCLVLKQLSSDLNRVGNDVYLHFDGKPCSKNRKSWISAINYKQNGQQLVLFWADSTTSQLFTGNLDLSTHGIVSITAQNLPNNSLIRNIAVDAYTNSIYLASSRLSLIIKYDLTNFSSSIVHKSKGSEKIGALIFDNLSSQLMWIQDQRCVCRKEAKHAEEFNCFYCSQEKLAEMQTLTFDSEKNVIYLFYQDGRVMLYDLKRKLLTLVSSNLLRSDKYSSGVFYTAKLIESNGWLKFLTSDAHHQSFRIANYKLHQEEKKTNYEMDLNTSRILFVDTPNIYDFILIDAKLYDSQMLFTPKEVNSYVSTERALLDDDDLGCDNGDISVMKTERSDNFSNSYGNYMFWLFFGLVVGILVILAIMLTSIYPFLRAISSSLDYDAESLEEYLAYDKF